MMTKGIITQINIKPNTPGEHGLPKKSINKVLVTKAGLTGDYNRYRQVKKSGNPEMAVMFIAQEILDDLNAEGWPVCPGDLGENFTTQNLPYNPIKENQIYKIGSAKIQVTFKCTPCSNLEVLSYVGKKKSAAFIKTLVDRRGWYAKVIKEGWVKIADEIRLITD